MSKIIKEYYAKAKTMPLLLKSKMARLRKHPDISAEFEYWITEQQYKSKDCVVVEGYSAERLAELSDYLDGEGAFMLLIELRENPQNALRKISNGFKIK